MNCACTYMLSLSCESVLPGHWKYKASLDGEHVFDAVITLLLLEDHLLLDYRDHHVTCLRTFICFYCMFFLPAH